MKKIYTTSQIRSLDKFAIDKLKFPSILLMENAVYSICEILEKHYHLSEEIKSFAIFVGKGNNGGDGITLARKLVILGHKVTLYHLYQPITFSPDARLNFELLKKLKSSFPKLLIKKISGKEDVKTFEGCDFYVDAILGSGSDGNLKDVLRSLVETLNKIECIKIAIDIPTGLNSETAYGEVVFNADLTVSLGGLKSSLYYSDGYLKSGIIEEGSIGVPPSVYIKESNIRLLEKVDIKSLLPIKSKGINKYTSGKTFVIAGSGDYLGAPVLVSKAAMKTGSGAVLLAIPESLKFSIVSSFPEVVVKPYNDYHNEYLTGANVVELSNDIEHSDVVIIGPGLGRKVGTIEAVKLIISKFSDKNFVIDADALYAISLIGIKNIDLRKSILTPHIGEFAAILKLTAAEVNKNLLKYGKEFVLKTKSVLVLKGPRTLIFNPDGDIYISPTGNDGMAKFGTGDLLSGMIGSLIAQGGTLLNSALAGVYLHGLCGDQLKEKFTSFSYTAGEIINEIPNSFKLVGV
ncbi:MAG: NAD(P)H-hydrate dehydratase [Ignavibacteriaceae bacterium]|nr:NAD(P)H-hydrate dehydratase [Ignavibacteriaceae bacterium]